MYLGPPGLCILFWKIKETRGIIAAPGKSSRRFESRSKFAVNSGQNTSLEFIWIPKFSSSIAARSLFLRLDSDTDFPIQREWYAENSLNGDKPKYGAILATFVLIRWNNSRKRTLFCKTIVNIAKHPNTNSAEYPSPCVSLSLCSSVSAWHGVSEPTMARFQLLTPTLSRIWGSSFGKCEELPGKLASGNDSRERVLCRERILKHWMHFF